MEGKKKRKRKKRTNKHHWPPRARDKSSKKTVGLSVGTHEAWHKFFADLFGEETVLFMVLVNRAFSEEDEVDAEAFALMRNKVKEMIASGVFAEQLGELQRGVLKEAKKITL